MVFWLISPSLGLNQEAESGNGRGQNMDRYLASSAQLFQLFLLLAQVIAIMDRKVRI